MATILKVENLTVRYILDEYKNMRIEKKLLQKIKGIKVKKNFYALKDISFSVEEGEVLGIIGKNGSGKSTLLKAISGTVGIYKGKITRKKKISALLELGTGFDKDLSVKENIFLRAALLGYSRQYIKEHYSEILEFSELTEYENYLYSSLSSGMRSRMAFSIVSVMQPEILVLDEIFSVGDGAYKQKSFDRMLQLMKSGISTILVSHSMNQIRNLCTRVIWIDSGQMIMDGPTETVVRAYSEYLQTGILPVKEDSSVTT